jgi:hypothetical protein
MFSARHTILAVTIAGSIGAAGISPARAADGSEITLYRSDSASLYASSGDGPIDGGYAVVREQRAMTLAAGTHDIVIGDLPTSLDAEALALSFPDGQAKVISQRLLLAQGQSAALIGLTGRIIEVLGNNGQPVVSGTLLRAGDGLLVRDGASTTLVTSYAGVRTAGDDFPIGSSLSLRVDTSRAGLAHAVLSYPTSGMGWRAAYVATLQPGNTCRMQFESHASIANRSGRDWKNSKLTLIAGEPNFAKESAPRPMMMKAARMTTNAASMPEQSTLADYRSYSLPAAIDLPDGSVSQVPLYAPRLLDCQRTALFDNGNSYMPDQPMVSENFNQDGGGAIVSTLKLHAFDSLPAGYLRVLTADKNGTPQFIGEGRINDTAKGGDATITLGTAFDLHAERTRTKFSVDKAGHTMNEAFRVVVSNAGDSLRTVTVREHPNRWHEWTLASSSIKPSQQTTDTLEFKVDVPAGGKTTLDYAVHYRWTADDKPQ